MRQKTTNQVDIKRRRFSLDANSIFRHELTLKPMPATHSALCPVCRKRMRTERLPLTPESLQQLVHLLGEGLVALILKAENVGGCECAQS